MKNDFPFPSSRLLGEASRWQHDEAVQIHLANYRTNRQLSLDGNLPGEDRAGYLKAMNLSAWALCSRLMHLTRETPVVPPVFF